MHSFAKVSLLVDNLISKHASTSNQKRCCVCAGIFEGSFRHHLYAHVNPLYLRRGLLNRKGKKQAFRKTTCYHTKRRPWCSTWLSWSRSYPFVCLQCRFPVASIDKLKAHFISHKHCVRQLPSPRRKDDSSVQSLQGSEYEEMAKLEIDSDLFVPDYKQLNSQLDLCLQAGAEDIALIKSAPCVVQDEEATRVSALWNARPATSSLVYSIPLNKRRSGLHGLRRNTQATICTQCFQVFLHVIDFELHSCCQKMLNEMQSNGEHVTDSSSVIEELAAVVAVRNESNLPPDLGNGYRRPLFVLDTKAPLDEPMECSLCHSQHLTIEDLHYHIVMCGRRNKLTLNQPSANNTLNGSISFNGHKLSLSDMSAEEESILVPERSKIPVNASKLSFSSGSLPGSPDRKQVLLSKSAPVTPVKQHLYNTRNRSAVVVIDVDQTVDTSLLTEISETKPDGGPNIATPTNVSLTSELSASDGASESSIDF